MLLINNNTDSINRIDRKLSKSIMLFKIKINIIKNKTNKQKLIKSIDRCLEIDKEEYKIIIDIEKQNLEQ